MKTRKTSSAVLGAAAAAMLGLGLGSFCTAQDAGKKPAAKPAASKEVVQKNTFTDPAKATPDFKVQGEYVGEVTADGETKKVAAQVVSLGGGNFMAAAYTGGLPGEEGWDGEPALEVRGKANEAMTEIAFEGPEGQKFPVKVADGKLTGEMEGGRKFEMTRIERKSPTLGAKPPEGATVLFDGTNADQWENGKVDDRGLLAAGTKTKKKFNSFKLHGEFMLPFKPYGQGQDRGNSGFYLLDRYEVQVLDSFGQKPAVNGAGALYKQTAPDLNAVLPPLQWQTYDIDFTAPEFDASGKKTKNAVITVKLNGVTIHDKREVTSKTGAGKPESPEPGPIQLQGHGNPVFFRNIWIVEK